MPVCSQETGVRRQESGGLWALGALDLEDLSVPAGLKALATTVPRFRIQAGLCSSVACYIFSAMMPTIGGVESNAAGFCSRSRHSVSNAASSAEVNRPPSTSRGT